MMILLGAVLVVLPPLHGQSATSPTWDGTYRRIYTPILAYQRVGGGAPDDQRTISPDYFQQHIEYLFYQGYTPISLYDLDAALLTGAPLPAEPVILTFDGGTRDHYQTVFPVLLERGFAGAFFVPTGPPDAADPESMSWEQIVEMSAAGMAMESQTKTMPDLRERAYDFLVYELLGSFESLNAYTGRQARMFAYPMGLYDEQVLAVLDTMEIARALTLQNGSTHTNDNRLLVSRRLVTSQTDVNALATLLQRGG
ncbi:MAG: polysaccharide deacetylase family protein [bacterium]|nr:polysaccharide deacetylase family protein [bacterium]